jgi:5-methylcytosine-specific restriction protein A
VKRNHRTPVRRPMRSRYRSTGPTGDVVDLVYERAQWSCEIDGAQVGDRRGVDHHIHHRRPRRMGGSQLQDTNSPVNLLLLCPPCHETVESERTAAYGGGWLVRQGDDPLLVPALIVAQLTHLTVEGGYAPCPIGCLVCGRAT